MKKNIIIRYSILVFFLIVFTIFSLRHFVLGGGIAASVDALCPFGGFETLLTFITSGGLLPRVMISSLVLGLGIFITTLVFRRAFCGWICPFGTIQELLGKITKNKIKLPEKIDNYARYIKYILLAILIAGSFYFGIMIFRNYDPFLTFFHFGKGLFWDIEPAEFTEHIIAFAITIVVLLGAIFIDRFWCRYLCPLGAVMGITSKIGIFKIKNDDSCNGCKLCDKKCPMNIKISDKDEIKSAECINCNDCIEVCPKNSLSQNMFNKKINPLFIGIGVVILLLVIVGISQTSGIWQSVPGVSLISAHGTLDPSSIKGWMTLGDISEEADIPLGDIMRDLNLPLDVDPKTPIKNIKTKYNIEFETSQVRDYVTEYEEKKLQSKAVTITRSCPWNIKNDPAPTNELTVFI